jgi:signal transduction histidine kinase
MSTEANLHGCKVRFVSRGAVPPVHTDPELLKQVILNFISNGIRYGQCDNPTVTISLTESDRLVTIAVKDNGIGIPQAERAQIFEKGFRATNALSMTSEGAGLGLYLVKKIADVLGARVDFDSVECQGTTFRFMLPR